MSVQSEQTRSTRRGPLVRVPQVTFASLASYLSSLKRKDLQKPLECPPTMNRQTWAQVHASMSALGVLQDGLGTFALRRLVAGETTLLDVFERQFGSDVIAAIERGESCAVGSLLDIRRERTASTIYRFESLVRMALRDQGRRPSRRCADTPFQESALGTSTNHELPARAAALVLLEIEGQHLVEALAARLDENDLHSVRQLREMLRDVRGQLGQLS
jgi:hypothetical protein